MIPLNRITFEPDIMGGKSCIRIISARKATKKEARQYRERPI